MNKTVLRAYLSEEGQQVRVVDEPLPGGVVLAPGRHEFGEVVGAQDRGVSGQVVETVRNDGHHDVQHDEGAEEDEGDEVDIGDDAAAALLRISHVQLAVPKVQRGQRAQRGQGVQRGQRVQWNQEVQAISNKQISRHTKKCSNFRGQGGGELRQHQKKCSSLKKGFLYGEEG